MYWIVASVLVYGLIVGSTIGMVGQPVKSEANETYTWWLPVNMAIILGTTWLYGFFVGSISD